MTLRGNGRRWQREKYLTAQNKANWSQAVLSKGFAFILRNKICTGLTDIIVELNWNITVPFKLFENGWWYFNLAAAV